MITREEAKEKIHKMLLLNEADNFLSFIATSSRQQKLIDELFDQQDQLQQHIKSLEAQLANTEQLACEWKLENDEMNSYRSSCNYVFYLEEGTPKMNDMNFCHKCGGKITSKDTQ